MRLVSVGAALLITAALCAAGDSSPHEEAIKQALASLDQISGSLAKVGDSASAKAATPELRGGAEAFIAARKRADALPPPARAEKDRLAKLYKARLEESLRKVFTEVTRVRSVPGGAEALREIRVVLEHRPADQP